MFEDDSNKKTPDRKPPGGGDGGGGSKIQMTMLVWAGIIMVLIFLLYMKGHVNLTPNSKSWTQSEFLNNFASNQIAHASINIGNQTSSLTPVSGEYYTGGGGQGWQKGHGGLCGAERPFHAKDAGPTFDVGRRRSGCA